MHDSLVAAMSDALGRRAPGSTVVATLVGVLVAQIRDGMLRVGQRLPSVRRIAQIAQVSPSTAAAVCERLVALGHVEARRGSGYYVRATHGAGGPAVGEWLASRRTIDASWLSRSLREGLANHMHPGSGHLPEDWFDTGVVARALRAVGRQADPLFRYGEPMGWLPLRKLLEVRMAEIGVHAHAHQILMTAGMTHALELVIGKLLHPGDSVLVEDPAWFVLYAKLRGRGLRLLPVPWLADGPDLQVLEALAREHRPKLLITQPVLHNPTGASISPAKAHRLLQFADAFDFVILENDSWGDLALPGTTRIATLDQLRRVIYAAAIRRPCRRPCAWASSPPIPR